MNTTHHYLQYLSIEASEDKDHYTIYEKINGS